MRRLFTLLTLVALSSIAWGQNYPLVSVSQINNPIDLSACNDTSSILGDTVRIRVHVVTDGGISEVPSGSVQGGNRPFIYTIDTAANGNATADQGIEIMGVYSDASGNLQPVPGFTGLFRGDKIEATGVVEQYDGNNQFTTLDANSITLLQSGDLPDSAFVPASVPLGDLNDNNRVNQVSTGEQWQNSFVELKDVTVVQVIPFSGGSRVSFNVQDSAGNLINVSDRFLAQKLPSHSVVNPNSPSASGTGNFVAPTVGTYYASLKGIVRHSANGCTGGTGRGYEINPFDSTHYEVGATAPRISNVVSLPVVPTSSDSVTINASITDADGTVDTAELYYAVGLSGPYSTVNLSSTGNNNYSATLAPQADGTTVRYYLRAVDNDGNAVLEPVGGSPSSQPFNHYTVRDNGLRIFDLQFSGTGNGESRFAGQTVSVEGVVTSARRGCDLEYVYLQDPADSIYSGIALIPNQDLNDVYRDQHLRVTGTVQETFGVTYLNVSSVAGLPASSTVQPVSVNPSDPNLDMEAYEGMLIRYEDPAAGQLEISNPDLGFGEYSVAVAGSSTDKRVLAGRQDGTRATSSLYVSLVSDTSYASNDGTMQVTPVATSSGMTMDGIQGVLWYSFGTYKLLPRNNFDILNLSTALDTSGCNVPTNVSLTETAGLGLKMYPNPAHQEVQLTSSKALKEVSLYNANGQRLRQELRVQREVRFSTRALPDGIYLLRATAKDGQVATLRLMVKH
ncbi:MAG: T9SS type A sorting domain-containing protein [Schleiferiaceae bacterium]|nr:T9SS type A sorting domain-containing protein [Schleiferiaceae bacterium]MDR9441199.1 T9SS type A sorting domain-containing protein [Schleiferiaceae bacterium]